jgi:hypothetical protein
VLDWALTTGLAWSMTGVMPPSITGVMPPSITGVMGPKEIAVLSMLEQGMDLVGEHVATRIHRRLDGAMGRVRGLETRLASLRQAVASNLLRISLFSAQERAGSHASHAASEGRDDARGPRHLALSAQGRQDFELEAHLDLLYETCKDRVPLSVPLSAASHRVPLSAASDRVPLSAASANQMRIVELVPVHKFSKVRSSVTFYGKHTGTLTFENVCEGGKADNRTLTSCNGAPTSCNGNQALTSCTRLPALSLPPEEADIRAVEAHRKTEHKTPHGVLDARPPKTLGQADATGSDVRLESLCGGGVVELQCLDSETDLEVATARVSVAAPFEQVRQIVASTVHASTGRALEGLRFADNGGGSIGLSSQSSWVLCKALRSVKGQAACTLTCVLGTPPATSVMRTPPPSAHVTGSGAADGGVPTTFAESASHSAASPDALPPRKTLVSFKNSPIMHQPPAQHLRHQEGHISCNACTLSDQPESSNPRKKKISDMKPPPMKRKERPSALLRPAKITYATKKVLHARFLPASLPCLLASILFCWPTSFLASSSSWHELDALSGWPY